MLKTTRVRASNWSKRFFQNAVFKLSQAAAGPITDPRRGCRTPAGLLITGDHDRCAGALQLRQIAGGRHADGEPAHVTAHHGAIRVGLVQPIQEMPAACAAAVAWRLEGATPAGVG